MTTGELFASKSTAPSGSTALYNLETLCQEGGCGEFGLIPITDILCEIQNKVLSADLSTQNFNANLETTKLNAIIIKQELSGELTTTNINGDLKCQ